MDYQWYFKQASSGSGTTVIEGTDYRTMTIPVTADMLSTECRITDIIQSNFSWDIDAIAIIDGVEKEVVISSEVSFADYSDTTQTAHFLFSWLTSFTGYININYWQK